MMQFGLWDKLLVREISIWIDLGVHHVVRVPHWNTRTYAYCTVAQILVKGCR